MLAASTASAAPPTILDTKALKITDVSALLEAEVNPGEKTTLYHFEYGLQDCETNPSPCTSAPAKDASISAGSSPKTVSFPVIGLAPGTTYHLRVVARNSEALGGVAGPDRTFTTHVSPFDGLPDGRAYEQATPVKKNAADARGTAGWVRAADDGDVVSFLSTSGFPGGEGGQEIPAYLASRGTSDWSTQGLLPPAPLGTEALVRGWLPDFSTVFDFVRNFATGKEGILLARSSADGSLTQFVGKNDGMTDTPGYAGASADGSKILFETETKLPCCPEGLEDEPNVYLWDRVSGQISLISVLNDEEPPASGALAGPYDWMRTQTPLVAVGGGGAGNYYTQDTHTISEAGDIVYFTAAKSGELYARVNPTEEQSDLSGDGDCTEPTFACTLEVSATHRTLPDPLGHRPAAFMAATPDGTTAFFASPEELTDDANTHPEVGPPPPHLIGTATLEGTERDDDLISASASALDVDDTHIYWATPEADAIGRALLDGTAVEPEFITGADRPQGVVIDETDVYWTNAADGTAGSGAIGHAMLDGKGDLVPESIEQDFISGANDPRGIAADDLYLYWANNGSPDPDDEGPLGAGPSGVGRADRNKSEVNQSFINFKNLRPPVGIAVNATHIYLTRTNEAGGAWLYRFEIGGGDGNSEASAIEAGSDPGEGALDDEYFYWMDKGLDGISRVAIDDYGQLAVEANIVPDIDDPEGLAVDDEHFYWSSRPVQPIALGNDLYRYRLADRALLDLTPDPTSPNGAEVKGVLGASEDGKRVYLVANGDLDGTGEAEAGDCEGEFVESLSVFSGQCSLYLAEENSPDDWSTTFVARLDASGSGGFSPLGGVSDAVNWLGNSDGLGKLQKSARVSADGSVLLFRSQTQLDAYDNEGRVELYRYEVGGEVRCVSCNPTGEAPLGSVALGSIGLTALEPNLAPASVLTRNLSADGNRVFFETTDALVADDVNGQEGCAMEGPSQFRIPSCLDVYEWEAQGTGSCKEDVQGGGCLYLLSIGMSPNASFFADASLSGDDAFIATRSAGLVGQDQDQLQDIYDARVGGGLPSQNQVPPPPCEGLDGCRPPATPPPASQSPGSASFSGPGNKKQARKHAKKRRHKKQSQKKRRQKAKQAAHKAGRGSR